MASINANGCISGIDPVKINALVEIIQKVGNKNIVLRENAPVSGDWSIFSTYDNEMESGLYAATLVNSNKELMIVFRGTDFSQSNDVITDLATGLDKITDQFIEAYQLYLDTKKKYAPQGYVITTLLGHSLGGGLAEYVGAFSGIKTYTFNGLGVKHLMDNYGIPHSVILPCSNIENYICEVDTVGNMFDHCSNISYYIPEPKKLIDDILIIVELNAIVGFTRVINNIAEIAHKIISYINSRAGVRGPFDKEKFSLWFVDAHAVENFKNLQTDEYSTSNSLIPQLNLFSS